MKRIFTSIMLALLVSVAFAQQPNMFKWHTGTLYTAGPFMGPGYQGYTNQMITRAADLTGRQAGNITKLYLRSGSTGTTTFTGLQIRMGQTTQADYGNYTGALTNFITPLTLVYNGDLTVSHTTGQWVEITLQTPFPGYNGTSNIVVETYYSNYTGTGINMQGGYYTLNGNMCTEIYNYALPGASATGNQYLYYKDLGFLVISSAPAMPVANFFTPPGVCDGSPVTLINTSLTSGWNIGYNWTITPNTFTYVNSSNATSKSPTVRFNATGNYTVKMRVSNNVGADSVSKVVSVSVPSLTPVADFYGNRRISAAASMIVQYFDLSTNCPQQWEWTSPDYESANSMSPFLNSAAQNSTAFFVYPGTWDVCLKATNTIGNHTVCKSDYMKVVPQASLCTDTNSREVEGFITDEGGIGNSYGNNRTLSNCKGFVIDPCASSVTLNFEQIKISGGAGDSIFVHNGINQNAPRLAAYGGGANGTYPSVTANSGKMFIYMITNASGVDSGFVARWTSVGATYNKPTASFTLPTVKGFVSDTFYSGYPISFTNTSTGVDAKYIWDVDGNSANDSTVANPKNVVLVNFSSSPLTFTSRLIAWNCRGYDTLNKNIVIMPVSNKPHSINFVADKINVAPGDTVSLRDLSTGATSWEWSFAPATVSYIMGTNKFSERPIVLIQGSGCIDVKLKVGNVIGIDSLTKICYLKGINYCVPGLATILNGDVGISNVTLGSINNTSGAGFTVYHNYFDSSFGATVLYRGTPYSISISRPTNIDPVSRRAWIDFNLDGVFSSNELIATETSSTNLTSTFTFSLPNNALTGFSRLRVGTTYANNFIDPCATFMGEFEDYKIVLARDTVRPVITLNGADTISVQINGSYTDPGATATDNLESNASISSRLQYSTDLDITRVGFYKACYDVTDYYGNQAITKCRTIAVKVDMTPPVLTMLGSTPVSVHVYSSYNDAGATASDNYSGNLTSQIRTVNGVDTSNVGSYQVLYTVQDYFGFTDSKTRTVNVIDTVAPVISAKGGSPYMHSVCNPLVDSSIIMATDNYYKNLTYNRTGSVDVNTPGTYAVSYTVTDGSGNISSTLAVNIQVADITKPVLSVASPDTVVLEVFTPFTEPAFTATDVNCLNNNNVTVTKSALPNKNVLGTYTYTVTATDASNNASSKSITVIYRDTQKPVVTLIGGPLVNWSLGKPWVDPGYGIIDNYYSELQLKDSVKVSGMVNTSLVGVYILTYKVTDLSGNISDAVDRAVYVGVTSVEEQLGSMAKMYPNPSNGMVNFEMLSGIKAAKVDFLNILGQVVFSAEITDGSSSFNISHLAAGNYVVRLSSADQLSTSKLVLTK